MLAVLQLNFNQDHQQQQYCALSSPRRHSTSTSRLAATSAAHTILPFAAIHCVYDNDNNIAHYHPLVAILRRLPVSLLPLLHIPYFHLPQFIACTTTTTILHTIIPSSPFYVDFPSRCYLCCTYHTSICRNSLRVRQRQQYCTLSSPRRHSTSTSRLAATSAAHTILPFAAIHCVYDNDNNIAHYHPLVAILRRLPVSLLPLLHILPFAAIHCVYDNNNNIAHYHPLVAILRRLAAINHLSQYSVSAIIFYHYAFRHHPRCLYYLSSSQSHVFAANFISFSASSIKVISTIHAFLHLPSLAFGHVPSSPSIISSF